MQALRSAAHSSKCSEMLLNYQSFKWMSAIWTFSWIHWLKQSIRTLFTLKTCYPYHWHSREKVSSPKDSRRYPLISSQNGTSIKHRNRTFIPFMKLISDKACMRLCQHLQTHKCTNILIHVSLLLNLIKKGFFYMRKIPTKEVGLFEISYGYIISVNIHKHNLSKSVL